MRVLVTGGAGYIGSHTTRVLQSTNHKVTVFDHLQRGHEWAVKGCPLIRGDLANQEFLRKTLQENQIEAVIHFAAHSCVGESMQAPDLYFRNNVINTLYLLEAMHEVGVKTLVYSSTAAVYGNPESTPISEDHRKNPVNPYGESKWFMERAIHWHGSAYGLRAMPLRYFNAAGAAEDGEIGESHDPETHLIPLVLQVVSGKRTHIDIYGTDYPTPDGTAIRDYIHVLDLAQAHIMALEYLVKGGENMALNLGIGCGHSVKEVIASVERVTGKSVTQKETPRRTGDPPVLVASADRAKKVLGWKPEYTELDAIVESAWKWEKKRK